MRGGPGLIDVHFDAAGNPQQYLRVHITNLRRKVELNPARPELIVTEPGVGYRAELPPPG